tara:strand:- start:4550 stop:5626 length:1077 start_codon:yes stop_codon:yes gene_type:complete
MEFISIKNETELLKWVVKFLETDYATMRNISNDKDTRRQIVDSAHQLVRQAYLERNQIAEESVHEILEMIYECEFSSVNISNVDSDPLPILHDICSILETAMLNYEIAKIDRKNLTKGIQSSEEYEVWFRQLLNTHKAGKHEYYEDFLPNRATTSDIRFLLSQETSLDPRFDDILALMQIGTQGREKMEIASNYWDEMGNGDSALVHTRLFSKALEAIGANDNFIKENLTHEAKVSGNISACLALRRRNYYKAVGYFGVTEYLAPRRFTSLVKAWEKNNLPKEGIEYHKLHIKIDAIHGSAWIKNVIRPLVESSPEIGVDIAIGALIRLNSSERYLDRLMEDCDTSNSKELMENEYAS